MTQDLSGHAGELAVAVARAHGVETMFTLSGAHVFPMYDGAVKADPPMRLLDVRHEQTAAFAAEATGKLTRRPGLAVLTAGPGVTNGISAITSAWMNGSPVFVIGGRAAQTGWGRGSLQELDHLPLVAPITKYARTAFTPDAVPTEFDAALRAARSAHRGPTFVDVPLDQWGPTEVVTELVSDRLWNSLQLASVAMLITMFISLPLGVVAAVYRGRVWDRVAMAVALLGQSLPSFWTGIVFILMFSVTLGWFPTSGMGSWQHYILPAVAMGWSTSAGVVRLRRSKRSLRPR